MTHYISLSFDSSNSEELQRLLEGVPEADKLCNEMVMCGFIAPTGRPFPKDKIDSMLHELGLQDLNVAAGKMEAKGGRTVLALNHETFIDAIDIRYKLVEKLEENGLVIAPKMKQIYVPLANHTPQFGPRGLPEPIKLRGTKACVKEYQYPSQSLVKTSPRPSPLKKTHYVYSELSPESVNAIRKGTGLKGNSFSFTWGVYNLQGDEYCVSRDLVREFTEANGVEFVFGEIKQFQDNHIIYLSLKNEVQLKEIRKKLDGFLHERHAVCVDSRFTPHVTLLRPGRGRHPHPQGCTSKD